MNNKLEELAKSLLGVYDWCKKENIPPSICNGLNKLLDTIYEEIGLNLMRSNKITLMKDDKTKIFKNRGLRAHENKKGSWFDKIQLTIDDKSQVFKSLTAAYIYLIDYFCKKYNKIIIRNNLDNCVKSIHHQLILKGDVSEDMKSRYRKINEGYLYTNLSSSEKMKRINYLIKELNENIKVEMIKEPKNV